MTLLFDSIRNDKLHRVDKEGREPLNITREQWLTGKWPPGSVWFGALGGAYGPAQPKKHWRH